MSAKAKIEPVSVNPATAAAALDMHFETFRDLMTRGVFTVLAPNGRGIGKRVFIPFDEVKLYGETRDELAVKELRHSKRRRS